MARNKEIRSSYHVGHGKGDGKRLWLFGETQDTKRGLEVKGDTLAFRPPFCHKKNVRKDSLLSGSVQAGPEKEVCS